jgi:hypothetical protein
MDFDDAASNLLFLGTSQRLGGMVPLEWYLILSRQSFGFQEFHPTEFLQKATARVSCIQNNQIFFFRAACGTWW